jgi:hypothetical protein
MHCSADNTPPPKSLIFVYVHTVASTWFMSFPDVHTFHLSRGKFWKSIVN